MGCIGRGKRDDKTGGGGNGCSVRNGGNGDACRTNGLWKSVRDYKVMSQATGGCLRLFMLDFTPMFV